MDHTPPDKVDAVILLVPIVMVFPDVGSNTANTSPSDASLPLVPVSILDLMDCRVKTESLVPDCSIEFLFQSLI